jgi:hypothetical protein
VEKITNILFGDNEIYCNFSDIKDLIGIEKEETHFDKRIIACTHIASNWTDTQLKGYNPSLTFKKMISLLYGAYIARTSIFESNTESESSVAVEFKNEAEKMVKLFKLHNCGLLVKVGDST